MNTLEILDRIEQLEKKVADLTRRMELQEHSQPTINTATYEPISARR